MASALQAREAIVRAGRSLTTDELGNALRINRASLYHRVSAWCSKGFLHRDGEGRLACGDVEPKNGGQVGGGRPRATIHPESDEFIILAQLAHGSLALGELADLCEASLLVTTYTLEEMRARGLVSHDEEAKTWSITEAGRRAA